MIEAILLDIEGTTTPLDFVHKTLFQFAKNKVSDFVEQNLAELQEEIAKLKSEYKKDFLNQIYGKNFDETLPELIAEYLKFLIETDRKSTPLKSIQGKIWKEGYESGELKSEIYEDVFPAFKRWKVEGKTLAIYSSGSRLAQKLLFKYTDKGDLTPFISEYFDTNVGGKREVESYRRIAREKSFPPVENFLFISDVAQELDAARKAGFQTMLAVRPGNNLIENADNYEIIYDFDGL